MSTTPQEPCDCLNYCGDDDRVEKGNVKPCDHMLTRRERERVVTQQLATITALRQTYGADNVFELVEKMHAKVEQTCKDAALWQAYKARKDAVIAAGMGRTLLREPVKSITDFKECYCPPDQCGAPVIMGRQTPCIRKMNDPAQQKATP